MSLPPLREHSKRYWFPREESGHQGRACDGSAS
jgi:hypothetical protein